MGLYRDLIFRSSQGSGKFVATPKSQTINPVIPILDLFVLRTKA